MERFIKGYRVRIPLHIASSPVFGEDSFDVVGQEQVVVHNIHAPYIDVPFVEDGEIKCKRCIVVPISETDANAVEIY